MDENQPNNPADAEYDSIKNLIPGLEDTPVEEPKEEITEEEPAPEEEPPAAEEAEEKVEEQEDKTDPEEEKEEDKTPPTRPEKYIPVKQYTSEKKQWKETEESLRKELEEAQAARGSEKEDAIKAYAEKHDVPEDSVRELFDLLGKGDKKSEIQADKIIDEQTQARLDRADQLEADQLFDSEFDTLAAPKLKTLFPGASEAQLKAAKKELEKISTTREFISTPLDKIVLASQEELAPIMGEKKARKGPETGRQAPKRGDTQYTADDFKSGKTSFTELLALSASEQTKIIEGMDMSTYDDFSRYIQRNEPVVINRGGRRVGT